MLYVFKNALNKKDVSVERGRQRWYCALDRLVSCVCVWSVLENAFKKDLSWKVFESDCLGIYRMPEK